ncbi:MAG: hypothetical protein R3C19_26585 [Planctomycetaceae bacterium]
MISTQVTVARPGVAMSRSRSVSTEPDGECSGVGLRTVSELNHWRRQLTSYCRGITEQLDAIRCVLDSSQPGLAASRHVPGVRRYVPSASGRDSLSVFDMASLEK